MRRMPGLCRSLLASDSASSRKRLGISGGNRSSDECRGTSAYPSALIPRPALPPVRSPVIWPLVTRRSSTAATRLRRPPDLDGCNSLSTSKTFCFRFGGALPNFPRSHTERWQSGLSHLTRNQECSQGHRGFDSHPLRHFPRVKWPGLARRANLQPGCRSTADKASILPSVH